MAYLLIFRGLSTPSMAEMLSRHVRGEGIMLTRRLSFSTG